MGGSQSYHAWKEIKNILIKTEEYFKVEWENKSPKIKTKSTLKGYRKYFWKIRYVYILLNANDSILLSENPKHLQWILDSVWCNVTYDSKCQGTAKWRSSTCFEEACIFLNPCAQLRSTPGSNIAFDRTNGFTNYDDTLISSGWCPYCYDIWKW